MKAKVIKRITASVLLMTVLLGGTLSASANTLSRTLGGVSFTAYSTITASSASAGTTSSFNSFVGKVTSMYTYYDQTKAKSVSSTKMAGGSGTGGAVYFTKPNKATNIKIESSHSAVCGTKSWSGKTSAHR